MNKKHETEHLRFKEDLRGVTNVHLKTVSVRGKHLRKTTFLNSVWTTSYLARISKSIFSRKLKEKRQVRFLRKSQHKINNRQSKHYKKRLRFLPQIKHSALKQTLAEILFQKMLL